MDKRFPSPESIRALQTQLRNGVTAEERETIDELLESARARVEVALSPEVQAVLASVPPQALEVYAILQQPVTAKITEQIQTAANEEKVQQAPERRTSAVASTRERRRLFEDDGDGMSIEIKAESEEEQAFLDAMAGIVNQSLPISQVPRGQALQVSPPVTFTMQLDPFQGAYKGLVEVTQGRGKKATKTTQTIAVHKKLYEEELAQVGSAVQQPSYWLPRYNSFTVYSPGEEPDAGDWAIGCYPSNNRDVSSDSKPTPEQLVAYLRDPDNEEFVIEIIKVNLRTPEQKAWLDRNDITISDVLNGRTAGNLDVEGMLFNDWNAKLGVKDFGF